MEEVIKIWVPFIGLISSISLAIFVLRYNPRNWISRTYFLYALYLAILNLGLLGLEPFLVVGMILLPIGFFQFVLNLTKRFTLTNGAILTIGYLVGLSLFSLGPERIHYNLTYNLLFGIFFIYSAILLYQRSIFTSNPLEKNRIIYLTLAIWIALLKFFIDIFESLGGMLSPFWNLTIVLQPFIMAYAIVKLKPMNLLAIFRKTIIYIIISGLIVSSYFLFQKIFEDFFRVVIGLNLTFLPSLLAGLALAILIQTLGEPSYNLFERIFFYEFHRKWSVIQRLNKSISQIFDRDLFLGTILNAVTSLIDVEKSLIVLWTEGLKRYEIQFAFGLSSETRRNVHLYKTSPLIKWQQENHHPILIQEVRDDPLFEGARKEIARDLEQIGAEIAFPFVVNGVLMGFLGLGKKKSGRPYRWEEIKLMTELCAQISGVLVSMTFYDAKIKEYLSIIQAFAFSIEAKDRGTKDHCERVSNYVTAIGQRLGLPSETIEALKLGGLIHDIGKLTVSDEILFKPGSLTNEEFEKIKRHPQAGLRILVPIQFPKEVIDSVLSHHERLSGEGYPNNLKGDEIPLVARIMAVADVYDAMTTDRQYRNALSKDEVKAELLRGAGKEYDPQVVHAFLSLLEEDKLTPSKKATD